MIISIEWLKQFVDINESPSELADLLSSIGLEAETISIIPDTIKGVVVGKVISVEKHPNADKLSLCSISDGKDEYQVVCGAPNVNEGQTIAYARIGSVIADDITIKKVKIRGMESHGMICSEKELGISDEHEGILVLPDYLREGDLFMDVFDKRSTTLELDVTPNRPDAFSHIGVARDIATKTDRDLRLPDLEVKKGSEAKRLSITMDDKKDCPRYIGGIVGQVAVGPSPRWMKERLETLGQRSINNLVDISNYVLMEMGHPTHIFDYDRLVNKGIHVRSGKRYEKLTTLDGVEHEVGPDNLLITDGRSPIALAGIMGGLDSSVSDKTTTVLVESAYFDPVKIRKGSKSLGVSTEASKRFERGADHEGTVKAFWRVIELLEEIANGKLSSDMVDSYPSKIIQPNIKLRKKELELVMGVSVDKGQVVSILDGLGFHQKVTDNGWMCTPPSFRPDLEREIDIIEEISRMYGFDMIPSDPTIYGAFRHNVPDPEFWLQPIRDTLCGFGFHQVYSNSLQNDLESKLIGSVPISIMNPLSREMAFLRTSLLPGLLKALDHNIKNGTTDLRLFELGYIHDKKGEGSASIIETLFLTGVVCGQEQSQSVHHEGSPQDIFSLKGYITGLLNKKLKLNASFQENNHAGFELSQNIIVKGETIGSIGRISTDLIEKMGLDMEHIFGFELNMDTMKNNFRNFHEYKKVNLFPKIPRRINFVIPESQNVGPLSEMMIEKGSGLLNYATPINIFFDDVQL
ncbi:MAG: phenylalanine--tRNA ligase subunit beta, partial [Candidatus Neomarinimicrobiota bacterium]|nr:phenylalanine--tRNA ligase subunit beta [Candidatus Neomarinimicrobiota bacterium]